MNKDVAFLSGLVIGDGNLMKNAFRIRIEMVSKEILEMGKEKFWKTFSLSPRLIPLKSRFNWKQTFKIEIESKPIWIFFNKLLDIPCGKKSDIIKIPQIILESDKECLKQFIVGLFLADGSFKRKAVRFVSASEMLIDDILSVCNLFKIEGSKRPFLNKKLNKFFFELIIKEENAEMFKTVIPDILIKSNAGVA